MSYNTFGINNFSGGLNNLLSSYNIKNNECVDILNLSFDEFGILSKRRGSSKLNVPISGALKITGLYKYIKNSGQEYFLCATETKLYLYSETAVNKWMQIYEFATASTTYNFFTFNDKCYIINGKDNLISYDGTAISEIGVQTSPHTYLFNNTNYKFNANLIDTTGGIYKLKIDTATSNYYQDKQIYIETLTGVNTGVLLNAIFNITEPDGAGANIRLQISVNNGRDWFYNDGNGWVLTEKINFDFATPIETFKNQLYSLTNTGGIVQLRIFPYSDNGANTPEITNIILQFEPTGANKFQYAIPFKNRVFYAGHPDYRYILFISELYDAERIGAFNWTYVQSKSGDYITGLAVYSDTLIIFTKFAAYLFYGEGALETYILKQLPTPIGCIDNKTIVNCENELLFLSANGLYAFTGGDFRLLSSTVPKTIDDAVKSNSFCAIYYNKKYYLTYYSTSENRYITLIYDYFYNVFLKYGDSNYNVYYYDYINNQLFGGRIDFSVVCRLDAGNMDDFIYFSNEIGDKSPVFGQAGVNLAVFNDYEEYFYYLNPKYNPIPIYSGQIDDPLLINTLIFQNFNVTVPYKDGTFKNFNPLLVQNINWVWYNFPAENMTNNILIFENCPGSPYGDDTFKFRIVDDIEADRTNFGFWRILEIEAMPLADNSIPDPNAYTFPAVIPFKIYEPSIISYPENIEINNIIIADIGNNYFPANINFTAKTVEFSNYNSNTYKTLVLQDIIDEHNNRLLVLNARIFGNGGTFSSTLLTDCKFGLNSTIETYWLSKHYDLNRADIDKFFRQLKMELSGSRGSLKIFYRLDSARDWTLLKEFDFASGDMWGFFKWGFGVWGGNKTYQIKCDFELKKNMGKRIQFKFQNDNISDFRIYSLFLKYRYTNTRI